MTHKVLIADDEPNIVISLEYLLKRAGYSRADALRAIGRLDILDARKEAAE